MADHLISISNSINSFGPAPSSKWGSMQWSAAGVGKWGEGSEDHIVEVGKYLSETQAIDGATLTLAVDFRITVENSQAGTFEMYQEGMTDGSGWNYVFTAPTTDAERRALTTYVAATGGTITWTQANAGSATWSDA